MPDKLIFCSHFVWVVYWSYDFLRCR